jgi:hypothetical protein
MDGDQPAAGAACSILALSLLTCSALASTGTQPPVMNASCPVSNACRRRCSLLLRS